jgi:hypothetical protein
MFSIGNLSKPSGHALNSLTKERQFRMAIAHAFDQTSRRLISLSTSSGSMGAKAMPKYPSVLLNAAPKAFPFGLSTSVYGSEPALGNLA